MGPVIRRLLRPHLSVVLAILVLVNLVLPGQALGQSPAPAPGAGQLVLSDDFRSAEAGALLKKGLYRGGFSLRGR